MAIINLTKETFKQQISEVDKPVIVDFWAPWCTYCQGYDVYPVSA